MKTLVFCTDEEKTWIKIETRGGYFSFTASTAENRVLSKKDMRERCEDTVSDLYTLQHFVDNPNLSFNDFVELEFDNFEENLDCVDFEETDYGCEYWEYTCGGQSTYNIPTELVELWDTYHLVSITDENKHVIDEINDIVAKYEIKD